MRPTTPTPFRSLQICFCAFATLVFLSGCGNEIRLKDPQEVVDTAEDLVLSYKIKDARKLLLNHEHLFPASEPLRPDFQYILSLCLLHSIPPEADLIERAEVEMVAMASSNPDHPRASSAWLYIGRMRDMRDYNGDVPRLKEAREAYQRVLSEHPDSLEAGEAAARYAVTFMKRTGDQQEDFEQGASILAEWLENHPETPQASSLNLFLAQIYDEQILDPEKALAYYQQADQLGFNNQGQAGSKYWRMAELARKLGQMEDTIRYCQIIIVDYTRSGRAYEAKLMLEDIRKNHPELEFTIPDLKSFEQMEVNS